MHTLALINGDLNIGLDGQYRTFSGPERIRQDLQLSLAEEYGTDRFHPRWGSVLKNYIGHPISPDLETLARIEVTRVLQNYILIGQSEIIKDSQIDVIGRFDTSDVVRSVDSVETRTSTDTIYVSVSLSTQARQSVRIRRQVSS